MAETTNREFELALSIDDISFKEKTLRDWETRFTIKIPDSHITNQEMQKFLSALNNKYHTAYNCYNEILVTFTKLQIKFQEKRSEVVKGIIRGMREDASGRLPAKDVIEAMALSTSNELRQMHEEIVLFEIIKLFFENSKNKLEKTMQVLINLSYLVSAADRVHYKAGGDPHIYTGSGGPG